LAFYEYTYIFFRFILKFSGAILLVVGDVVDSGILGESRDPLAQFLKVLIAVEVAYICS
jgi:hypothetical protein